MKKAVIMLSLLSLSISAQDELLYKYPHRTMSNFYEKIKNFFHVPEIKPTVALEAITVAGSTLLSPFQALFRQTISFTSKTNNILCSIAETVVDETKERYYTLEQAIERFIEEIQEGGTFLINRALIETLDVDLEQFVPTLISIHQYVNELQQTISKLQNAAIIPQIEQLISLIETTQQNALDLQKAGILSLSADLASYALFSSPSPLVDKFRQLYNVYPVAIEKVEELPIIQTGLIVHSAFNLSSELIEKIVQLHDASGKIGDIFVHGELIHTLDVFKNQIRKLGNAIEFVTSTQPLIVVAPPTTTSALLQILQNCVWRGGLSLRPLVEKEIEHAVSIGEPMIKQIEAYIERVEHFLPLITHLPDRLHVNFVAALKKDPLKNIPESPLLLLELFEAEIIALKKELNAIVDQPIIFVHQLCDLLNCSVKLLSYTNTFMGSSEEQPFIHRDVVRGLGFIAQDADMLCNTIKELIKALDCFKLLHNGDKV